MTKLLLAGTVGLAVASAGLMAAGGRGDPPKPSPDQPPKAAERPAPKPDPKADGKALAYTDRPRLRRAIDLDVPSVDDLIWSPDGNWLALPGPDKPPPPPKVEGMGFGGGGGMGAVGGGLPPSPYGVTLVRPEGARELKAFRQNFDPANKLVFAGFTPDAKQVVYTRREYDLLSGRHELWFRGNLVARDAPFEGGPGRIVDLDPDPSDGVVLAPDGKAFRTVGRQLTETGYKDVDVREVGADTGRTIRTLVKVSGECDQVVLSPDGRWLGVLGAGRRVTVYRLPDGREAWSKVLPLDGGAHPLAGREFSALTFSPDGRLLFAARQIGESAVVEAATGTPLPPLAGGLIAPSYSRPSTATCTQTVSFSADGRLLSVAGERYIKLPQPKENNTLRPEGNWLTVWDTATGKVVRAWPAPGFNLSLLRFHPKQPILAVAEPNGDKVRLGLWDFAAEPVK